MLRAVRAVMQGPLAEDRIYATEVTDANPWRRLPYLVLLASLLVFGFFPRLLTDKVKPVTEQIVKMATLKPAPTATPAAVVMVESK
jgi:NADH:ubiquinone oxidoreductase subunit 4 (subunit M)